VPILTGIIIDLYFSSLSRTAVGHIDTLAKNFSFCRIQMTGTIVFGIKADSVSRKKG
jgi:hypothetical protein